MTPSTRLPQVVPRPRALSVEGAIEASHPRFPSRLEGRGQRLVWSLPSLSFFQGLQFLWFLYRFRGMRGYQLLFGRERGDVRLELKGGNGFVRFVMGWTS